MIRKAEARDAEAIRDIILPYAQRGIMLHRTLSEIQRDIGDFLVFEKDGEVLGVCSLKYAWDKLVEIRSLAVREGNDGEGIGTELVRACIEEASRSDCTEIFVLTYAIPLFEKLGFRVVPMDTLPQKVWNDCRACLHRDRCDETAMIRSLKPLKNAPMGNMPLNPAHNVLY